MVIPPSTIDILTDPKDLILRQGEEQLVPTEFETLLSVDVSSIIFDNGSSYSLDGLNVSAERGHPSLFRVAVSPQTPAGRRI